MAKYPVYDFNDPTLDYDEVEKTVKQMRACVISQRSVCCKLPCLDRAICTVNIKMRAMGINKVGGDVERYQRNVRQAYEILFKYARCYVVPEP